MERMSEYGRNGCGGRMRVVVWGAVVFLFLLPLLAMLFTGEFAWSVGDFVVFGVLLASAGIAFELTVRMTSNATYHLAAGVAVAAVFFLVWLSLGVGIIGRDGDPANLMYFGVIAVGLVGAIIARFRPPGMARALLATALAQALVAAIALVAGLGLPWSGPAEILALNGFFVVLFAGSAWLFVRAGRRHPERNDA